jgi:hypothetical protein
VEIRPFSASHLVVITDVQQIFESASTDAYIVEPGGGWAHLPLLMLALLRHHAPELLPKLTPCTNTFRRDGPHGSVWAGSRSVFEPAHLRCILNTGLNIDVFVHS